MALSFVSNVARRIESRSGTNLVGSLFEMTTSGRALGAEIRDVDVTSFDDWAFAALMRALLKHQVLIVRDQTLGEHDLARFRRRLGQASVLHAPATALTTASSFSSLYAIYDALPPALRRRIAHLKIRHVLTNEENAPRYVEAPDQIAINSTIRPLVCIHPDTGRSVLDLGERHRASLVGVEPAESDALLEELWQLAARAEFNWQCTSEPGDLLIWDPRCTMHRRIAQGATRPRLLHRAEIWSSISLS
jgi:taurine dioxygenase